MRFQSLAVASRPLQPSAMAKESPKALAIKTGG